MSIPDPLTRGVANNGDVSVADSALLNAAVSVFPISRFVV